MINSELQEYAEKGVAEYRTLTVEDAIRGYMGSREVEWALRTLIDWHKHGQEATGLKVGDKVRVRRCAVCLGDIDRHVNGRLSGWAGYAPLFSDCTATVREVSWNAVYHYWGVTIEYDVDYRWGDWKKDFWMVDETVRFHFAVDQVKKVRNKKEKRLGCI